MTYLETLEALARSFEDRKCADDEDRAIAKGIRIAKNTYVVESELIEDKVCETCAM